MSDPTLDPRPLAFLPIITKARELDGRMLLAGFLVRAGYRVLTGRSTTVYAAAANATSGLFISPLLVPAAAARLAALRRAGVKIIAWDEEGLVYPDPDWYFSNRISAATANEADAVIAWGPQPADDLRTATPQLHRPVLALGNPRIDVLRSPYRSMYESEAAALRAQFGNYLLVNSNFDLVNHVDGPDGLVRRMRASGRISDEVDEQQFRKWGAFRQTVFDDFLGGIPRLRERLPDLPIIIRPHPSESLDPWNQLAESVPGVSVQAPRSSVLPWIVGARAVVHNSCTTAVEAFMLNVPVIAVHPPTTDDAMGSPLPNELSRVATSWEQVADLVQTLGTVDAIPWVTPQQQATADRFISGRTGDFSCQGLVTVAHELGADRVPTPLPPIGPSAMGRARLRRTVLGVLGRRAGPSVDDRQRFGDLSLAEMASAAAAVGRVMGEQLQCQPFGDDAFVIDAA